MHYESDAFRRVRMEISPEIAAEMLARNMLNRRVKAENVNSMSRDMASGNWMETGQSICFDKSGALIDGQHRLRAIIASGATISFDVVFGLDPMARHAIDAGSKRTMGDRLQISGVSNANVAAATISFMVAVARNRTKDVWPSAVESMRVYQLHGGLIDSYASRCKSAVGWKSYIAGAAVIAASLGRDDVADSWCEAHVHGVPAYPGDPAHALRERIIRERTATRGMSSLNRIRLVSISLRNRLALSEVSVVRLPKSGEFSIPKWTPEVCGIDS